MERLLTTNELADILQVKPSTIRAWVLRRKIPFVKLAGGRPVRYRESDIRTILKTVPALRPLAAHEDASGENGGAA